MKKITSTILFVLSLLFVVLSVAGTIYAIYDIDRISNDLADVSAFAKSVIDQEG